MVPTTFHLIRTLARRRRVVCHRDAVADAKLDLPRRIDGPAAAAQLAGDLRRHRCEDITPTPYLDDRHRLVGTAIVAAGWVQAPRPSTRPILHGSQARRATGFVSVRSRRWGTPNATEPEDRTLPPPRCCVQPIRARCGRSRGGGGGRQWLVRLDSASPAVSRSVAPLPVSEHPCNIITLCLYVNLDVRCASGSPSWVLFRCLSCPLARSSMTLTPRSARHCRTGTLASSGPTSGRRSTMAARVLSRA